MKKVTIDPGHGPGNVNKGPTGYYEYIGMWKLSNYLKAALIRCGIAAELTRKEDEVPSLDERGKRARGSDVFISEHSNAANGTARGAEVYYSVRISGDRVWAGKMAAEVAKLMGNNNRGAKTKEHPSLKGQDYYGVIRSAVAAGVPHVFLAESGFHDNPTDEAFLKVDSNLELIAEAQAKVICEMLDVKYIEKAAVLYRVRKAADDATSQIGAFSVLENATKEADDNKDKGYKVFDMGGKLVYDPNSAPDQGGALYRVRKAADDAASQIGAYSILENAKTEADKNQGYKVYDMDSKLVYDPGQAVIPPVENLTSIMGQAEATKGQARAWLEGYAPDWVMMADLFCAIAPKYNIRADVALCQAAKETGFFRFSGLVQPWQNNFAGIGATGQASDGTTPLRGADPDKVRFEKGVHGAIFADRATGVEAQIQHLYAYATTEPLPDGVTLYSPRFTLVRRGSAAYVEHLGAGENPTGVGWAYPGKDYGQSIMRDYMAKLLAEEAAPETCAECEQLKLEIVELKRLLAVETFDRKKYKDALDRIQGITDEVNKASA